MAPLFGPASDDEDCPNPSSPRASSDLCMPPRSRSRWAAGVLALLAVSVLILVIRPSRFDAAGCAASAAAEGVGEEAQGSPLRLWRLEDMGVHHYAFPGLLTSKEPVVFHVWLKAQRQAGKVLLR
jgi:hypothetical protein